MNLPVSKDFTKKHNSIIAHAICMLELLEDEEIEKRSALFNNQFVKDTLLTRSKINRVLDKAFKTESRQYTDDVTNLSIVLSNFIDFMFEAASNGRQDELLNKVNEITLSSTNISIVPKIK